jgi:hypothetical protein
MMLHALWFWCTFIYIIYFIHIYYLPSLIIFACLLLKRTTFVVLSCTLIFHCQILKRSCTCIMYYVVLLTIVLCTDVASRPVGSNSKMERPNLIHPKTFCLKKMQNSFSFGGGRHEPLYTIFHFTKTLIIYFPFHGYLMAYASFWYVYHKICLKPLSKMAFLKCEVSLPITPKCLYHDWWGNEKTREIHGFEYTCS